MIPAFANSVISCGRTAPVGFASRSYQPKPGWSPKSLPKPAMFVEFGEVGRATTNSGRP